MIRQILADDGEPQRRVGGVAVGNVVAVNCVGQRAVLFKFREREQNLLHLVRQTGGEQAAGANERVAAPVEKPRITGDDGLAFATADDELFRGAFELRGESLQFRLSRSGPFLERGTPSQSEFDVPFPPSGPAWPSRLWPAAVQTSRGCRRPRCRLGRAIARPDAGCFRTIPAADDIRRRRQTRAAGGPGRA